MNQLSTTSVANIKRSAKKITLISAAIILAATLSFQATDVTKADDYDRRIAEIEREIEGYQDEAQKLNDKAQSLQKELTVYITRFSET